MKSNLIHHGIAASYKNNAHIRKLKSKQRENSLVYASPTNIINLCEFTKHKECNHLKTNTTLKTYEKSSEESRITCLNTCRDVILVGYSNGIACLWYYEHETWNEIVLTVENTKNNRSIIDIDGILENNNEMLINVMTTPKTLLVLSYQIETHTIEFIETLEMTEFMNTLSSLQQQNEIMLFIGSACHARNFVSVYRFQKNDNINRHSYIYCGTLQHDADWITCLSIDDANSSNRLLASGCMDGTIRLWNITTYETQNNVEKDDSPRLSYDKTSIYLDALLLGHEDSITKLYFYRNQLVSSSMDQSIFIWYPEEDTEEWIPQVRIGSVGGIIGGSIGSTMLGFTSVLIHDENIVATSYGGSVHLYSLETNENTSVCTGHFGPVKDISFGHVTNSFSDYYLCSVSFDQTCRLWASVTIDDANSNNAFIWKEVGRPQIHGYNLNSLQILEHYKLISAGDETIIRYFDAPSTTVALLHSLSKNNAPLDEYQSSRKERGYVPSLGLSNRAQINDDIIPISKTEQTLLPLERELTSMTVWPEIQAVTKPPHDTEVVCLECYQNIAATASKARDKQQAVIRIWHVTQHDIRIQAILECHTSTVVTMSFHQRLLVSAGKDRRLCLWYNDSKDWELLLSLDNAHKRIIWSVEFYKYSQEQYILASASRDGFVKVWQVFVAEKQMKLIKSFQSASASKLNKTLPVTALSFAPISKKQILAVGLENGAIEIWDSAQEHVTCIHEIHYLNCHSMTVTKLKWKPTNDQDPDEENQVLILASCSDDFGVRLFEITLSDENK